MLTQASDIDAIIGFMRTFPTPPPAPAAPAAAQ
jgi:hypothetical protein